jgi:transposase
MSDALHSTSSAIAAAVASTSSHLDRSGGESAAAVMAVEGVMPIEVQQRIEVIQRLLAVQGTAQYGAVQRQAARSLGITVRSVQRLVKAWREQGLSGVCKQSRRDRGASKVSRDWQQFIVKTYRDGNRGSRRMSAAQVAVRVQVRVQDLGVSDYPGRTTVYRILQPHIEKTQQPKRSIEANAATPLPAPTNVPVPGLLCRNTRASGEVAEIKCGSMRSVLPFRLSQANLTFSQFSSPIFSRAIDFKISSLPLTVALWREPSIQ